MTTDPRMARLVEEYDYLCRVVRAVNRTLPTHLRGEAESAAQVAMVEAARAWRDDRGVEFRAFVAERVRQRMVDAARRASRYDRTAREARNDVPGGIDFLTTDAGDPVAAAEFRDRLDALAGLSVREAVALTATGTEQEIGEQLGVSPSRVSQLRSQARSRLGIASDRPPTPLSPAEMSVFRRIAEGKSNQQAADELGVSIETVKTQMRSVLRKTGTKGRAEAVHAMHLTGLWDAVAAAE